MDVKFIADGAVTDSTVMLLGQNDKPLAEKILTTNLSIHYGDCNGHR